MLSTVNTRLEEYFEHYNLIDDSVIYVQIGFKKLDVKLSSQFSLVKPNHVSLSNFNSVKTQLITPVYINQEYLGNPLSIDIVDKYISNISVTINNEEINFLDLIRDKIKYLRKNHPDNISSFSSDFNFYLLKSNISYILGVKLHKDGSIEKIRYSLQGVVINHVFDKAIDYNLISRKSGTKEIILRENKLLYSKNHITFKYIEKPKQDNSSFISNPNIGVIDAETYLANDNVYRIYSIGFMTNLQANPVTYYVEKDNLNSGKVVLNLIDELLRPKYSNIVFYCHNLGGFDIVFILKTLYNYNDNTSNMDKYSISCVLKDDRIMKVKLGKGKTNLNIFNTINSRNIFI